MTIYIIIGGVGKPLAVYTDPLQARFCDEIKAYVDGYQCIRETHSDIDNCTYIDYIQKTTCEFGPVTHRKTVTIYCMELS